MQGRNPRPIYQQIAVVLYMLGGGEVPVKEQELHSILGMAQYSNILGEQLSCYIDWHLNISIGLNNESGSIMLRRMSVESLADVLASLMAPSITLRYRPMVDPEAYFS